MCIHPILSRRKKPDMKHFKKQSCPQVQAFHFPKCESKASLHALLGSGVEINTLEKIPKEVIYS